tara:strand:- start:66 stop:293 length:228 start_codon:yes stop_codon:yes gene_type:complete
MEPVAIISFSLTAIAATVGRLGSKVIISLAGYTVIEDAPCAKDVVEEQSKISDANILFISYFASFKDKFLHQIFV